MQTPRSVPTQRRGKHNTEVEEGEKRGEKDTNTGLREGKTEPRERERDQKNLGNHPSPTGAWVPPHPAPAPHRPPVPKLSVTIKELWKALRASPTR